jgi:hypothetical protein
MDAEEAGLGGFTACALPPFELAPAATSPPAAIATAEVITVVCMRIFIALVPSPNTARQELASELARTLT